MINKRTLTVGALLLVAGIYWINAGDLEPPGAPAPTMKMIDELEPRTQLFEFPVAIDTPGSYYLMGNVVGAGGITIVTSNVTIDLNGFTLAGPGAGSGIDAPATLENITIRNGTVHFSAISWPSAPGFLKNSMPAQARCGRRSTSSSIACSMSACGGSDGAMRILRSCGSLPYGYVAPALVSLTPASAAIATTSLAQPSTTSRLTKYPPVGLLQLAVPVPPSSFSRIRCTASNFGARMAACFCMCVFTPSASLKNFT